jgi:hypothetical protein
VVLEPVYVPWSKEFPTPTGKVMTEGDLQYVEDAFIAATKLSASAGREYHNVLGKLVHPR